MIDYDRFPVRKVTPQSPAIPAAMWEVFSPPQTLYIQGSDRAWDILREIPYRSLAIVGTRAPKFRTLKFLEDELARLREKSFVIISGFALGIDRAAHAMALRLGLPTIGVLAAGHDLDYPRENQELRLKILESDGLLISELAPGEPAHRQTFIRRNRLIAGWAKATWIVEAPRQSGALNTAYWSYKNGRDTYATASFPQDPDYLGNHHLICQHRALALHQLESLQQTWPGLMIKSKTPRIKRTTTYDRPLDHLIAYFDQQVEDSGAVHLDDLLQWWRTQTWPLEDFFLCLDSAQKLGKIKKEQLLVYG